MKRLRKKPVSVSTSLVTGFLVIILIGATLLSLPISSKSGEFTSFFTALFTATSATCVTGLVLVDTYTHWNSFGQGVILVMIQIGGLGFMTMATLFSFILRRKITLKERLVMTNALNISSVSGVVRLTKRILYGTFLFEGVGAFILSLRFIPEFGILGGIKRGIFLSVSAFCNAGFDILGHNTQFNSLTDYVTDPVVNITIALLIILGGVGFFVWGDIIGTKRRYSTHTKITLIATSVLLVSGTFLFLLFEYNNPLTIGDMTFFEKLLASFFQSTTTRTAGFNTISQADLTDSSLFLTYIFMFIGGSPGSTAGGIKTLTIAILILVAIRLVSGRTKVTLMSRNINNRVIMNSLSIFIIGISCVAVGILALTYLEPFPFDAIIYEVVSAFATVGLSFGITGQLTMLSQMILMVLMFLGRVGVLTLGFSLFMGHKKDSKISYPDGVILIG